MEPTPTEGPIDLGTWVLDHGLPLLPAKLDVDETIATARWAGEEYGAVLFVSRYIDEEQAEFAIDTDVRAPCGSTPASTSSSDTATPIG